MPDSLPAAPQPVPGLPDNADFFDFAGWNGIDTQPPRAGVADDKAAWMDNLFPLAANDIRAMPDCGTAFYTATNPLTIIHFDFFGLQPMGVNTGPYIAIFFSDGSAVAVSLNTAVSTPMGPPGTFEPPVGSAIATRQFGTQYFLIATEQNLDSYWIWDGSNLFGAGTLGPEVDITDGGTGYISTPTITAVGGDGAGATFSSTVVNGSVSTVTVTDPGSGWFGDDPTEVLLLFAGGGSGTSAYGTATVVDGAITAITVVDGGSGFTAIPAIVITDATGSGAHAVVSAIDGGVVTGVKVIACGLNYTAPAVSYTGGSGGINLTMSATLQSGVIVGCTMNQIGSGYKEAPQVSFISVTGSGASATAVLSAGTIVGIDLGAGLNAGFSGGGYTGPVLVAFTGGGGPASATVQLMPFGVQGSAIETYQSRVWIATTTNVVKIFFTAPDSVTDFGPGAGGGAFPASDSTLRYQFTSLVASIGFLYLVGDSNVNYVSGVQTSGSPATTTFSNLNIDPQIGSPWRDSVQVYSRAIMMANTRGVFAITGGAVQMVSTPLNGIYDSAPSQTATVLNNPSSAVAEIFNVHVYMLLLPIVDPVTGSPRNALLCWDGKKWWSAGQRVSLVKIATQEWGGQINAWGTDGTSIYKLFSNPAETITKTLQTKLWTRPGIYVQKKALQLYAFWQSKFDSQLNFTIDYAGGPPDYAQSGSTAVTQGQFLAGVDETVFARSNAGDVQGTALGVTMTSVGADFSLMNLSLLSQQRRLKV